jgi:glucokinase
MKHAGQLTAGVDLGGSNLRVGLVTHGGTIAWRRTVPTPASHSPEDIVQSIVRCLRDGAEEQGVEIEDFAGIGIGIPGAVDPSTGLSRLSPNLGWKDVPFGDLMQEQQPRQLIAIDNDVRVVTYGEWAYGAGQGATELMCVTVGTGVGSGLVLEGDPYRGSGGAAGEIGHIQLDPAGPICGCGNRGCLEVYASARAVCREAEARGLELPGDAVVTGAAVAQAAAAGDDLATQILADAAAALAHGVAAAVNLLNLERVIIGGGLSRAGEPFWAPFAKAFSPQVMAPHLDHVTVVPASLEDDAGILGAVWMVRRSAEE